MATVPPTRAQVERDLSHRIQSLYHDQLGHRPSKVECKLLDEKLMIIINDSITKPEQLLTQEGQEELAEQVRLQLNEVIQDQLKALIEAVLRVPVLDLLSDAALESGRSGMIVILTSPPTVRDLSSNTRKRSKPSSAKEPKKTAE
jgi:uncharacterized protein YbcI